MPVYRQKEEYNEETVADKEITSAAEEEIKEEPKKAIRLKLPKRAILYGVVSVGILVLLLGILSWSASRKHAEDERKKRDAAVEEEQFWLDYYDKHPEMSHETQSTDTAQSDTYSTLTYSSDQIKNLRKWGYTGSEIEDASASGLDYDKLIDESVKQQKEAMKDTMSALNDTMSPEYKNLLNKTWLSGEEINLDGVDTTTVMNQDSRVENVDFEKCGAQGTQLFLKLHLDNGTAAFMCIDPQRYVELPDTGNIVVEIAWTDVNSAEIIVGIKEVRVN